MESKTNILCLRAKAQKTDPYTTRLCAKLKEIGGFQVDSRTVCEIHNTIGRYDCVLVAPQVKFDRDYIVSLAQRFEIPILDIRPDDYACRNVDPIVEEIKNGFTGEHTKGGLDPMSETTQKRSFMDKMSDWMEKYIVPVGTKISNQRHLAAIRNGLTVMIPATIIGGFAMLLAIPPIPATITEPSNFFYAFLLAWKGFAAANSARLLIPYYLTISIISIYVVCGVSYEMARTYKMNTINNMIAALLVFLAISGALDIASGTLTIAKLGAGYMFSGMVIAILVVEVNRFFIEHNITIKMPASVPPNVAAPFNVLIPMAVNVVGFLLLDSLIMKLTGAGLSALVYTIFQPLMKATGSLPSVLLINFLMTTFWFFGIHGGNMVGVVTTPITTAAIAANAEAFVAGEPLPFIYAGAMNSVFGNWITYNAMLLVIFLFCKSNQTRSVAKVAIVPSCFNINEPSIFGLPTVLNVYTYIPMLICSVINCSTYYLLAQANVLGRFYVTLPFTVPGPLQALLATGDVKTVLVWLILYAIDMAVVFPFITAYDKTLVAQEQAAAIN